MRPLIATIALALVVTTSACWFPDKGFTQSDAPPPADAPPGPLDCHNVPTPTVADPHVTIKGTVVIAPMGTPLTTATVQLFASSAPRPAQHVDAQGQFSFDLATGGAPTDIHVVVTENNYLTTIFYPAESVTKNIEIDPQMFDKGTADYIAGVWGSTLDLMNKVQVLVGAVDCQDNALGNVTAAVSPAGDGVHYFVNSMGVQPDRNASVTDSQTGAAAALNLPPQFITVSATVPSPKDGSILTMLHHSIDAGGAVGALIQTKIRP
jgi:hypothetical protein